MTLCLHLKFWNSCFYLIVIWPSIYPSRWYLHKQLFLHHWPNTRNIPSIINPHFIWSLFISHSINVSCAAVAVGGEWVQILNERESDVSGPPRSCPKRHRRRDGRLEGEIDNLTLSSLLSMCFSQTAKSICCKIFVIRKSEDFYASRNEDIYGVTAAKDQHTSANKYTMVQNKQQYLNSKWSCKNIEGAVNV